MKPVRRCRGVLFFAIFIAIAGFKNAIPSDFREIEFRVTDHQDGIEDFNKLDVQLESVAIHPKIASRNNGWIVLATDFPLIDIVPLKNGLYLSTGTYQVPSGVYDAVRVKFKTVDGDLYSDMPPSLSAKNTTIATNIDLSDSGVQLALVLDLYVESQTDHEPNLYVVKVKEIRVGSDSTSDQADH